MNTKIAITLFALTALNANAQTHVDALRFNQNDVQGTARSQAMASAFGALGADLTSMAINPAGMATYRASEIGISLGVNVTTAESNYFGNELKEDRVKVPFNQLGAGFSFGIVREEGSKGIVGNNLFLGYNRLADYNTQQEYRDGYAFNSLLDYFCTDEQKEQTTTGDLAYNAYLTNDTNKLTYNVWENYVDGGIDNTFRYDEEGLGLIDMHKRMKTTGYKGEFTIGYATNISNKVYIGGSIGIVPLEYSEVVSHAEQFWGYTVVPNAPDHFSYKSYLDQDGTGCNFKLGIIVRPINALRIGFSLHSPTFFNIKEQYWAEITNPNVGTHKTNVMEYEYNYRSPSRMIASVAGVMPRIGLLSFDFERTNNSRSKFKDNNDDMYLSDNDPFEVLNDDIRNYVLKGSNTFRIGFELSALNPLYIRMGARVTTPSVNEDFYCYKPKHTAFSGGLGYRNRNIFVDIAYTGTINKEDHWVLPASVEGYIYEDNSPASITTKQHCGVVTLGFRF